ncbi:MAG: hypothetical protein ABIH23_34190, partial [bacterium]
QMAASALALRCAADISGNESLSRKAEERVLELLNLQDEEGFFPEYGGADVGYHSLTISLLATYYKRTSHDSVLSALRRAIAFLNRRLFADATFDYRLSSRRTQFLYPSGLVRCHEKNMIARHLLGCRTGQVLLPSWMDDRYCFQLATDYLIAGILE